MELHRRVLCTLFLVALLLPIATDAQIYKCVDPVTSATTYSDKYCMTGNVTRLTVTENAIMDGVAAQREIAFRRSMEREDEVRRSVMRESLSARHPGQSDAYERYKMTVRRVGPAPSGSQARALARAALETQRADAVYDAALAITAGGGGVLSSEAHAALETCKERLHSGSRCGSSMLPTRTNAPTVSNGLATAEYVNGRVGNRRGMALGHSINGTYLPGAKGGTVVGGPLNGTYLPGAEGGMVVGGPLNGTYLPGAKGGTVVGGPLNSSRLPSR
jgi:hypothetical protein